MYKQFKDPFLIFLLIAIGALFAACAWIVVEDHRAYAAFMAECTQDRRHYECLAMWKSGSPAMVPVVVPVR